MTNNKFVNFIKNKYQSLIYLVLFALIICAFLYAIVFMNNMWILNQSGYATVGKYGLDRENVFVFANSYNNLIFISAIILIISTALAVLFGNRSRKIYYISNYIFGFLTSISAIILSLIAMLNAGLLKNTLYKASYGDMVFYNSNVKVTDITGINFIKVISPNGFAEMYGFTEKGLVTYVNPVNLIETPNFSMNRLQGMVNISFVLYSLTIVVGGIILAITIKKLIEYVNLNKKDIKEEN